MEANIVNATLKQVTLNLFGEMGSFTCIWEIYLFPFPSFINHKALKKNTWNDEKTFAQLAKQMYRLQELQI